MIGSAGDFYAGFQLGGAVFGGLVFAVMLLVVWITNRERNRQ